jgi:hypothetical protein
MTDDERKQSCDIGRNVRELIGQAATLQVHPNRVREAEEHAGRASVERIIATKHDRHDRDPTPARTHVFGEDADCSKRKLSPRKTRERTADEHCDDPIAEDVDAERACRLRLFAYAA